MSQNGEILIEKVHFCSETGLRRQENQDAILTLYKEEGGLFLIADGMGGHYKGELASKIAVIHLKNWWLGIEDRMQEILFQEMVSSLELAIQRVNGEILKEYKRLHARGGCTLCLLLAYRKNYAVVNVGDSHIYRYGKGIFENMMSDDVWENQKYIQNMASEEELKKSSHYGQLTQVLGIREIVSPCIRTGLLDRKDCFFLSSDGVYKYCHEKMIKNAMKRIYRSGSPEKSMERIKRIIYKNGAGDNLSMIMILTK